MRNFVIDVPVSSVLLQARFQKKAAVEQVKVSKSKAFCWTFVRTKIDLDDMGISFLASAKIRSRDAIMPRLHAQIWDFIRYRCCLF